METQQKKHYEGPTTLIYEINIEGVICESRPPLVLLLDDDYPTYNGFGNEDLL